MQAGLRDAEGEPKQEALGSLAQGPLLLLRSLVPLLPWSHVASPSFYASEAGRQLLSWHLDLLALGEAAAELAISLLQDAPNTGACPLYLLPDPEPFFWCYIVTANPPTLPTMLVYDVVCWFMMLGWFVMLSRFMMLSWFAILRWFLSRPGS